MSPWPLRSLVVLAMLCGGELHAGPLELRLRGDRLLLGGRPLARLGATCEPIQPLLRARNGWLVRTEPPRLHLVLDPEAPFGRLSCILRTLGTLPDLIAAGQRWETRVSAWNGRSRAGRQLTVFVSGAGFVVAWRGGRLPRLPRQGTPPRPGDGRGRIIARTDDYPYRGLTEALGRLKLQSPKERVITIAVDDEIPFLVLRQTLRVVAGGGRGPQNPWPLECSHLKGCLFDQPVLRPAAEARSALKTPE